MTPSSETDVQAGMTAPRRAAGLLRVIATASTIVGLIGGLIIGQAGDDGTAGILLAQQQLVHPVDDLGGALAQFVAAVHQQS